MLNAEDELRYAKNEAVMDIQAEPNNEDKLRAAFKLFDADGSGKLDLQEFKDILTRFSGSELSDDEAAQVLSQCDQDGDGRIDIEEFIVMLEE